MRNRQHTPRSSGDFWFSMQKAQASATSCMLLLSLVASNVAMATPAHSDIAHQQSGISGDLQRTVLSLQQSWKIAFQEGKKQEDITLVPPLANPSSVASHPYKPFFFQRVGCILLAGGQGSRLGAEIPKGCVPIPPSGITLFEIFLRKAVGFHKLYHIWPVCAIMTSDETDEYTRRYLQEKNFFGVPKECVSFFCQSSLPLLDEHGEPVVENGTLVTGPDGNGKVFSAFHQSGLYHQWSEKGVQAVTCMPIDNPMMDPFLPSLFEAVLERHEAAAFAAVLRRSATEKTGVFCLRDKRLHVIEYSEISDELRHAKASDGTLLYSWANISVCTLQLDTIAKLSSIPLPVHFAKKLRGTMPIYKPEYYIFDNFPAISSFSLVGLDRATWFSPIKTRDGEDSLEDASRNFRRVQKEQAERAGKNTNAEVVDPAELYGCA